MKGCSTAVPLKNEYLRVNRNLRKSHSTKRSFVEWDLRSSIQYPVNSNGDSYCSRGIEFEAAVWHGEKSLFTDYSCINGDCLIEY